MSKKIMLSPQYRNFSRTEQHICGSNRPVLLLCMTGSGNYPILEISYVRVRCFVDIVFENKLCYYFWELICCHKIYLKLYL